VALFKGTSDQREAPFALIALGRCFVLLGDLERAEATFTDGLELARRHRSMGIVGVALTDLAHLKLRRRDYTSAATLALEALRGARALESRLRIKSVVVIAALVTGHRADIERTARLLAAADAWSDWGRVLPPYDNAAALAALRERARQQMGEAAYRTAVAEAGAMSVEQVADLAQACLEPPTARGRDGAAPSGAASRPLLSDREQAVLRLISEGLPNKQIATALSIRHRTVKSHVTSAMNKLGVDNRAHAAVVAIQRGLL
jgi:DNA-binding NarL/FixJ family response regulator